MLPDIHTKTVIGTEYTFTVTGGTPREFMGDGCSSVGRPLGFLAPCQASLGTNTDHVLLKTYRRRIQDFFLKSFWYRCARCDGSWPE